MTNTPAEEPSRRPKGGVEQAVAAEGEAGVDDQTRKAEGAGGIVATATTESPEEHSGTERHQVERREREQYYGRQVGEVDRERGISDEGAEEGSRMMTEEDGVEEQKSDPSVRTVCSALSDQDWWKAGEYFLGEGLATMHHLLPDIFWSDRATAENESILRKYKFDVVVTLDEGEIYLPEGTGWVHLPLTHERRGIKMLEIARTDIIPLLLRAGEQDLRVLVHCQAGRSRSGAMIALMLMSRGICLRDAWTIMWLARGAGRPPLKHQPTLMAYLQEVENARFTNPSFPPQSRLRSGTKHTAGPMGKKNRPELGHHPPHTGRRRMAGVPSCASAASVSLP